MSMMQRRKGKLRERQLAAYLTSLGYPARRGVQYHGGTDSPDVVADGLEAVHIECKGVQDIDLGTQALRDAYGQSEAEAGGKLPVVFWRRNGRPWALTWRMDGVLVTVCGDDDVRAVLAGFCRSVEKGLDLRTVIADNCTL